MVAHKKKAAALTKVRSIQKIEEGKKREIQKDVVPQPKVEVEVHNEEVLFMKRVFPHIISLPEDDLGLNL